MPGSQQSDILDSIFAQLERVRKCGSYYKARCPSHDDREASLSITPMADGGIRLKCFAGCETSALCGALGVTPQELIGKQSHAKQEWTYYDYVDECGNVLYQHVRIPKGKDKTFLWCRSDGRGGKIFTLNRGWQRPDGKKWKRIEKAYDPNVCPEAGAVWFDDARRVLYRADKLSAARNASAQGKPMLVLYVEGEKDVATAEAYGFLATTAGGSKDWRPEYAEDLRGLDLVIIPDNDESGYESTLQVANDCKGKAKRIRIRPLPEVKKKGDLTDWFEAGGTKQELQKLIDQASDYEEILLSNRIHGTPTDESDESDPVLSTDPKVETWLRMNAMHAGDVIDAIWLLFRMLGIKGKHSRLINALIALATHPDWRRTQRKKRQSGYVNLGIVRAYHSQIHGEYESDFEDWKGDPDKAKCDRVSRDIRKFRDECIKAGVGHRTRQGWFGLMDYWQGSPALEDDQEPIPGRYRLNFLRFALLILDREREISGNRRKAREQAAQQVALEVMLWVSGRIAALGEQPQTIEEKPEPEKDPLKVIEQKREAAIRACRDYAQLVGSEKAESALLVVKNEALDIPASLPQSEDTNVFAFSANRAIAAELEVEATLKQGALKLREAWQAQGFGLNDALHRTPVIIHKFLSLLFSGSGFGARFKYSKRKDLLFKLAHDALSLLFDKNVEHGESENLPDDGMNITVDVGSDDPIIQAVIEDDSPLESPQPVTVEDRPALTLVDSSPPDEVLPESVNFPPETKGPQRERVTDQGYRGPAIYLAPDGDIPGQTVSYAGEVNGEHWLNFEWLDGSGTQGTAPLSALLYPDENFAADAELIEGWRQVRQGDAARGKSNQRHRAKSGLFDTLQI